MKMYDHDRVNLLKQDKNKIDDIVATVAGSDLIVIKMTRNAGRSILIEPGDLLQRRMSNGGEETFEVIDPCFHERGPGYTGPHYQARVRKLGLPEAKAAVQQVNYNVSGQNARVNVGSVDHSTNTVTVTWEVNNHLDQLRAEIKRLDIPADKRSDALEVVDEVADQFASGKPKRSIVTALLASLPLVTNVVELGAAITGLL